MSSIAGCGGFRSMTLVVGLAAAMLLGGIGRLPAAASDLTDAWRDFRRHQAAAETAKVEWDQTFWMSEQSVALFLSLQRADGASAPAKAAECPAYRCTLSLHGDRARFESAGCRPDGSREPCIDAFDGSRNRTFVDLKPGEPSDFGTVKAMEVFDEWKMVHLIGLTLVLRPLRPELLGENPEKWTVESRAAPFRETSCLLISATRHVETGESATFVYLDPKHEHRPLRHEGRLDGRITHRVDLFYDDDDDDGNADWIPSSWESSGFMQGSLWEKSENAVKKAELGVAMPPETFTIDYPPGTQVAVAGEGMKPQDFVAGEDGRLIPRRQHLAAEAGSVWESWWLDGLAALALCGAAVLWLRQRRSA
jgi:hypothetical protein